MAGTEGRGFGGGISASRPGALPIVLVAVALLFCHGVFGYAHQMSPSDADGRHDAHAAGFQQPGSEETGVEGAHPGDAYFAILLALLFGTFLPSFSRALADAGLAGKANPRWDRRPTLLPPPRGPTLPSLQVFRL